MATWTGQSQTPAILSSAEAWKQRCLLAYSLYLFIRDIADNDLVTWIDNQLASAATPSDADNLGAMREALLDPLRHVYGVSDKVLSMALSELLMAAPRSKHHWAQVGTTMIAIDTLVHNFLHRTGILKRFGAAHPYGPACYGAHGCVGVIQAVANQIDAREFNPRFPKTFPRFVQNAIWRYCSENGIDVCNGNRDRRQGPVRQLVLSGTTHV